MPHNRTSYERAEGIFTLAHLAGPVEKLVLSGRASPILYFIFLIIFISALAAIAPNPFQQLRLCLLPSGPLVDQLTYAEPLGLYWAVKRPR